MNADQGYIILAGKCESICRAIAAAHPEFRLVRGHYWCPLWNCNRGHWWLETADGVIYDPTRDQFPSRGAGTYTEYDGMVSCAQCSKTGKEEEFKHESNYHFCSDRCFGKFVGVL